MHTAKELHDWLEASNLFEPDARQIILRALSLLASVEGSSDEVVRGLAGFTPGPWEWLGENSLWGGERGKSGALEEIFSASDDGKDYGMHSAIISHHWDKNVAEANRKLIAAAPQLLAHIIALQAAKVKTEGELASVRAHAEAMANSHDNDGNYVSLASAISAYRAAHPKDAPKHETLARPDISNDPPCAY